MKKPLVIALILVSFLACNKDDESIDDNRQVQDDVLNLPEVPYAYANQGLPAYLLNGPAGGADNTPLNNPVTDKGATLGRVLFYDKNLSINNTISCSSCHSQADGFSDTEVLSKGFEGGSTGRHSMQLTNARFYNNGRFFWDERASSLEEQTLMPIQDLVEMGMTLDSLEKKLSALDYYPDLFADVFGDNQISSERISLALSQFIRSMVSFKSKYDIGRQQVPNPNMDFPNFSTSENRGKALFSSPQLACNACHGTDAFIAPGSRNNGLDATVTDNGVGNVSGNPRDNGRFKVGSLKNIAATAPYMHDGRFSTLEEVVEHYNSGVQAHPNLDPPLVLPNGQARRLNLTQQEKDDLIAFLNTLTDDELLNDIKFSSPFKE